MFSSGSLSPETLGHLHPSAIKSRFEVRAVVERLQRERILLRRGLNRKLTPETARIEAIEADHVSLRTFDFEPSDHVQVRLNFQIEARPHFFVASVLSTSGDILSVSVPEAIYRAERRDRARAQWPEEGARVLGRVRLRVAGRPPLSATVADVSAGGLGLDLPDGLMAEVGSEVSIEFLDGGQAGTIVRGRLCHEHLSESPGVRRAGVSLLNTSQIGPPLLETSREGSSWRRARSTWQAVAAGAAARSDRLVRAVTRRSQIAPSVRIADFIGPRDEHVRGLINWSGASPTPGAPAVVIPPAWGRTKETLLPLAATIVAAFEKEREPVTVVRFDGVRRRGESFNDPECQHPGREHHRFTFSQGVDDIRTVVQGLDRSPEFAPSSVTLVTFSAASIDGRRAVALDNGERISGWVSVVGSADLQSMMRVISGGVDFVGGVERGLSFGMQELLGVEVDIDWAGADALSHKLGFLEDSCRDMDSIRVPVTWIHGRHDAWMDLERARTILSRGNTENRRLIIVPTGHQLRTSREAMEVFQLVAGEVGRLGVGRVLRATVPRISDLEARRKAERGRLATPTVDKREFWRRYLVGRDGSLGIELMTSASSYRQFMREQIEALGLARDERVIDLGSGTGAFLLGVAEQLRAAMPLAICELDYVREGLVRARTRLDATGRGSLLRSAFIACDLSAGKSQRSIPFRSETYDAAIASLLISYVDDPVATLTEVWRVLKPGGRLVLSGLRRDADMSKLFVDALGEIARGGGASQLDGHAAIDLERSSRDFLNDATRLLDLEELGVFEFREATELSALIRASGFEVAKTWSSFGDPPQAVVVLAYKPSR